MNNQFSVVILLLLSINLHGTYQRKIKHSMKNAFIAALGLSKIASGNSLERQYGTVCTPHYQLESSNTLYTPQYTSTTFCEEETPNGITMCPQEHTSDEYTIKTHNAHTTCTYKKIYNEECLKKANDDYLKKLQYTMGIITVSTIMGTCLCFISLIAD